MIRDDSSGFLMESQPSSCSSMCSFPLILRKYYKYYYTQYAYAVWICSMNMQYAVDVVDLQLRESIPQLFPVYHLYKLPCILYCFCLLLGNQRWKVTRRATQLSFLSEAGFFLGGGCLVIKWQMIPTHAPAWRCANGAFRNTHLVWIRFDASDEIRVGRAERGHQGVQRVLQWHRCKHFGCCW